MLFRLVGPMKRDSSHTDIRTTEFRRSAHHQATAPHSRRPLSHLGDGENRARSPLPMSKSPEDKSGFPMRRESSRNRDDVRRIPVE
jgi:hypothetical protein